MRQVCFQTLMITTLVALLLGGCGHGKCQTQIDGLRRQVARLRDEVSDITAQLEQRDASGVKQPRRGVKVIKQPTGPIQIVITTRSVAVDDNPVDMTMLHRYITKAMAADAKRRVIISTAPDVPHGRVVQVMDTLKAAGATRIGIATGADR